VVAGVEEASYAPASARWYPKVARSSVEDDFEVLAWGSESNWSVVLSIHVVGDWDILGSLEELHGLEVLDV